MKRGPKPRQVTQDLLEQIEHHVARGLSQKQICDALGFSETWWHAKKAEYSELGESYKKGSASGLADVMIKELSTNNSSQSDTLQVKPHILAKCAKS